MFNLKITQLSTSQNLSQEITKSEILAIVGGGTVTINAGSINMDNGRIAGDRVNLTANDISINRSEIQGRYGVSIVAPN